MKKRINIRTKLIRFFLITSLIPIVILGVLSSYNIAGTLRANSETLIQNNLKQMDTNLKISLEAYEDILYQAYTNDDIVSWIENIDEGKETALNVNQMRRTITSIAESKDYIRAITVITPKMQTITYDKMGAITYRSSWIDSFSKDEAELYKEVSSDAHTHIYATEYATTFANADYYTLQMAHRIVNYRDIYHDCGIVVISIDQELLEEICTRMNVSEGDVSYFADKDGNRICFLGKEFNEEERNRLYTYQDEDLGWSICYSHNESELLIAIQRQILLIIFIAVLFFVIAGAFTYQLSGELTTSTDAILAGMAKAEGGDLSARVSTDMQMPAEIERIAVGFNGMTAELDHAHRMEQEAIERQREAQIVALEAQINPHFIYNTLDSINWMAIDRDEYDISNAINALANILRYAISDSSKEVTISKETEWLKKYIFLQQFRTKNSFDCEMHVQPEIMQYKIHKLLIQPFVENSILHAFEKSPRKPFLQIVMEKKDGVIEIRVEDNGVGMPEELVQEINSNVMEMEGDRTHIGMANAITRMKMYYGDEASLWVDSREDEGTVIIVRLPLTEEKEI